MQIIEKARSNPKTEDLDQLFKEMMRTLESNVFGPTELYSIPPTDLIPTGLGDAELREYMQSAIKPCVDWATNVSDQLRDFSSKVDQKKTEASSDSESQLHINQLAEFCLLLRQNFCKTLNILKLCANAWSTHFDDSDFQESARVMFDDCRSTFQNLRSLILCIVRHPYTQGLLIDRVEDEEARRNGKPSS